MKDEAAGCKSFSVELGIYPGRRAETFRGPDGRYYLYYFLGKQFLIGVAVCDEPAGKFEFYDYVHYADGERLGEKKGDTVQFDPGVYVEGDKVYLYTGWCPASYEIHLSWGTKVNRSGAQVTLLEPDMVTVKQAPRTIVPGIRRAKRTAYAEHPFFEASSMRKIRGKYYFIYSSHQGHELCYAVSNFPDGVEFHRKYARIDPGAEREVLYLLSPADESVAVFPSGMCRGACPGGGWQVPAVGDDVLRTERRPAERERHL